MTITIAYIIAARNKKKLLTDLVRKTYRVIVFILECNTIEN